MADNEVRIVITGKDAGASAALRDVRGEAEQVGRAVEKSGSHFAAFGKTAGIAAAGAGLAFGGLSLAVLKTGFDFNSMRQQAEIAFGTMLGDGQKAKAFLDDLQQFAAKTPFEFPELVSASQKMLAMGFAASDVRPLLTAVGDAVAGLGGSSEMVNRVTTALGQMKAKGKVSAEEMMQLTEAGIPAWQMLADAIGVDVPAAMKLAEKGAISADTAIAAIQSGMQSRFGGMMDKQSKSFAGVMSTLKDTFSQVSGQIAGPLFEKATTALQGIADFVSTPEFSAGVTKFTTMLGDGFARIGEIAGTIGPPIIEAIGSVVEFVQGNWPAVRDALVRVWDEVLPRAVAVFDGVRSVIETLRPVAQRVMDDIKVAAGAVVAFFEERWPRIEAFARQVFDQVKGAITEIAAEIAPTIDAIVSIIERVVQEIGERWGALENVFGPIIQHVMDTVTNILTVAKNLILLIMNLIQGDWSSAWENIKNIAGAVWDQVYSLIDNALKLIQGLVPLALGLIADLLSLGWEKLQQLTALAWEGIKEGVRLALDALLDLVKQLPGLIVEGVGDLSKLLLRAGKAIIQGLIDGITDKLDDLKDLLGRVTSLIPSWKGPLDRDRKLLFGTGQAIIDGLIDGIGSRLPDLQAVLEGATGVVRSAGAAMGAAVSPSGGMPAFALAAAGASPHPSYNQSFQDVTTGKGARIAQTSNAFGMTGLTHTTMSEGDWQVELFNTTAALRAVSSQFDRLLGAFPAGTDLMTALGFTNAEAFQQWSGVAAQEAARTATRFAQAQAGLAGTSGGGLTPGQVMAGMRDAEFEQFLTSLPTGERERAKQERERAQREAADTARDQRQAADTQQEAGWKQGEAGDQQAENVAQFGEAVDAMPAPEDWAQAEADAADASDRADDEDEKRRRRREENVPAHAEGGVISEFARLVNSAGQTIGTMAEAGPEAILPLGLLGRAAAVMGDAVGGSSGLQTSFGGAGVSVLIGAVAAGVAQGLGGAIVQMDGREVGRLVTPYVSADLGRDALLAGIDR